MTSQRISNKTEVCFIYLFIYLLVLFACTEGRTVPNAKMRKVRWEEPAGNKMAARWRKRRRHRRHFRFESRAPEPDFVLVLSTLCKARDLRSNKTSERSP